MPTEYFNTHRALICFRGKCFRCRLPSTD